MGSNSLSADVSKGHASGTTHIFGRIQQHPCAFLPTKILGSLLDGPMNILQCDYRRPPHRAQLRMHQPCWGANIVDTVPRKTFGTIFGLPITNTEQLSSIPYLLFLHRPALDPQPKVNDWIHSIGFRHRYHQNIYPCINTRFCHHFYLN